MKTLSVLLFIPFLISASPISHISCFEQVTGALDRLGTVEGWMPFPDGVAGRYSLEGKVLLYLSKDKTEVVTNTGKTISHVVYTSPKCEGQMTKAVKVEKGFSDFELAQLLKENKAGIIYLWSPHMELSVKEVSSLKDEKLPYPVKFILDPKANEKLARKVASENKFPEHFLDRSLSEKLWKDTVHYPTAFFYKDQNITKSLPGFSGQSFVPLGKGILK